MPPRPSSTVDLGQRSAWLGLSLRSWLAAAMLLACAPLAAALLLQAIGSGRAGALGAAVLAGCASIFLAWVLAGRADRRLAHDAVVQARAAASAARASDDFLALLSHELRNPLGSISAAVDVLDSTVADPDTAAEARSVIARQTRHLSHMLHDLLDVSRLVAGKAALARQPLDLAALAQRVQQTIAAGDAAAGHLLTCRFEPAWVDGDPARLDRAITRLVTEALRHAPSGDEVALSVRREGASAVVEVQHRGAEADAAPDIGLALVRTLVELHDGTLDTENSALGSRSRVRLPAAQPGRLAAGARAGRQRVRQLLLVDDDHARLAALRSSLEREGHTVHTAPAGQPGQRLLLRQRPEVVIVAADPAGSELELARQARAAGYAGWMIALADAGGQASVADAMAAGFDACLPQPPDPERLRASIDGSDD